MAMSRKLATLSRAATTGLTDAEVMELTGLGFATWRRLLTGMVPSDKTIMQFCEGLGVDAQPFIEAAAESRPSVNYKNSVASTLARAGFSADERVQVIAFLDQIEQHRESSQENSNAA